MEREKPFIKLRIRRVDYYDAIAYNLNMIINPFKPELVNKINQVLKKNDIVYAGIFGSYAKNMQNSESDIDLLIEFNPHKQKTLFDMVDIQYELQDIFNKKVDLVTKNSLNKYIKNEIVNSVKVIYG